MYDMHNVGLIANIQSSKETNVGCYGSMIALHLVLLLLVLILTEQSFNYNPGLSSYQPTPNIPAPHIVHIGLEHLFNFLCKYTRPLYRTYRFGTSF